MSIPRRIKRDGTHWAIVNDLGTISTYKFDNYDPRGRRDFDEKREHAYDAAFKSYRLWIDQPCMQHLNIKLIER